MKKKTLCLVLVFIIALCASACSGGGELKAASENLTGYSITAAYDEETKTLTASENVTYVNRSDAMLKEIKFHLYPAAFRQGARFKPVADKDRNTAYPAGMSYGSIEVTDVKAGGKEVEASVGGQDEDILTVPLGSPLAPNQSVKISMLFTAKLPEVRHRFGYFNRTVNLGNFYPIACAYSGGGFKEDPYYSSGDPFFSECANYSVKLSFPAEYDAAVTGNASVGESNGIKTVTATARAVRDFAAVLSKSEKLSANCNGVTVDYYYYADETPEASLKAACDALKTFSNKFGKYPYDTYAVSQTAFKEGGMEYPQMVMISDSLTPEMRVEAIVHETAHQWWYGVVGNDQISHPWLDEALAEFSTTLFYKWNPSYGIKYEARIGDALGGLILYCDTYSKSGSETSMSRRLPEYADALEYSYMTYVKGAVMLDTLMLSVGENKFVSGLKTYYAANKFSIATPDHLIAAFEKATARELKSYFDSWIDGKTELFA